MFSQGMCLSAHLFCTMWHALIYLISPLMWGIFSGMYISCKLSQNISCRKTSIILIAYMFGNDWTFSICIFLSFPDCGDPAPENGVSSVQSGTLYGAQVNVSCNSGYNLIGPSILSCVDTGWNASVTCQIQGKVSPVSRL